MHIADGVLPVSVAGGAFAVAVAFAGWGVRKIRNEDIPKIAVVTSSFFVASLVHIPFGPTSVHLLLPGLVGALLGPAAFVSITLGLILQSLLFQFGGLTALGANAIMMGIPAMLCGMLFRVARGESIRSHAVAGAVCGGVGTAMAAFFLALLLALAGENFFGVAKLALAAHIPVFVIEGIVSAFVVSFLRRVKPEILAT